MDILSWEKGKGVATSQRGLKEVSISGWSAGKCRRSKEPCRSHNLVHISATLLDWGFLTGKAGINAGDRYKVHFTISAISCF